MRVKLSLEDTDEAAQCHLPAVTGKLSFGQGLEKHVL